MEPILVIMAAGMGSRYGGNKQLDEVTEQGDIIMDFSLYDAYQAGFRRVAFVIKKDFEEIFRSHIEAGAGKLFETHYVYQQLDDLPSGFEVPEGRVKPWGTGHAVLAARSVIDAPFAVINADDFYGREAFRLVYEYLSSKADREHNCMIGFRIENTLSENGTVSRGICRSENGILTDIEEHFEVGRDSELGVITGLNGADLKVAIKDGTPVSMNLWGFGREFMDVMARDFIPELERILAENPIKGEFYLPTPIRNQIESGESSFAVLTTDDKWFGVTYKEDKPEVVARLKEMKDNGTYPEMLWG
ncbi:MAG: sugar phosphate nucleotidyltransferase [Firmicutes bacterium]|nr:sugar phosphate nucleotidyltransferase [Bacillota bacterium]